MDYDTVSRNTAGITGNFSQEDVNPKSRISKFGKSKKTAIEMQNSRSLLNSMIENYPDFRFRVSNLKREVIISKQDYAKEREWAGDQL